MLPAMSSATRQHAELDEERHPEAADGGADEQLAREPHLLDQVGVGEQRAHPAGERVGEEGPRQQAAQQEEREDVQPARVADGRVDLQEEPEDEREDRHLRERVEQRPAPAEDRPLVLAAQLPQREVREQLSVAAAARRTVVIVGGPCQRGHQAGRLRYRLMRITFVSAHYPPNFVSGGTLQPQRLARGLPRRGHDVARLRRLPRRDAPPLETWDEVDEHRPAGALGRLDAVDGLGRRAQLRQPRGGRARSPPTSREHPADVVHLHALQTLGVGLVEVAKASGARDGRHDARLLVGLRPPVPRRPRPTAPAASWSRPATARARSGAPHLERRSRAPARGPAPRRPRAGAVALGGGRARAPTASPPAGSTSTRTAWTCRRPGRPRRRPAAAGDRPVVVRYTGGQQPDEGGRRAPRRRPRARRATPGLRIIAHGLDDAVRARRPPARAAPRSSWRPPYAPDELDDVLAATDVLVLPSVMRESHSLVTREALLRGVPVVVTDTLGPEEVVDRRRQRPRRAGRRPRRCSPPRCASLDDPAVLDAPAGGARTPRLRCGRSTTRSTGSSARYERARRPSRGPRRPGRAIRAGPVRRRHRRRAAALPRPPPRRGPGPARRRTATSATTATPTCAPLAAEPTWSSSTACRPRRRCSTLIDASARARARRCVFDVDDLIFDPDIADEIPALRLLPPDEAALWLEGVARYRTPWRRATPTSARPRGWSSTPRRSWASTPTCSRTASAPPSARPATSRCAGRARPARSGSATSAAPPPTTTTGATSSAAVVEVLERPSGRRAVARRPPRARPTRSLGRARRPGAPAPVHAWHDLPDVLRDLDVNLAPLEPGSRFNDAKSAIKWLEAALVATPTIASPSAPFRDAIEAGRTGWLADDPAEWADAARARPRTTADRPHAGRRPRPTRARCCGWSPHLQGDRYLADPGASVARPARATVRPR